MIWLRIGDAGGYESFDYLDDVIAYLNESKVGQIIGWVGGGFETTDYCEHNYISCFWGDEDASFIECLNDVERNEVTRNLDT